MSKPEYDLTHEELNPKIDVGHGNPGSPLYGQLLSEEDEKRVDDMGEEVVNGLVWSDAKTDVYLSIALHMNESSASLKPMLAKVDMDLTKAIGPAGWCLTLGTTHGKPTFMHPVIGACLELPADLANDKLKRQYVVEWIVNTVDESLRKAKLGVRKNARKHFAAALADAANTSIQRVL